MKVRAKWVEGVSFVGESGSGHTIVTDGAPDAGGRNLGMRPVGPEKMARNLPAEIVIRGVAPLPGQQSQIFAAASEFMV